RAISVLIVTGAATTPLLHSVMQEWPLAQRIATLGILSVTGLLWWASLEWSASDRNSGGVITPLLLVVISATLAMALMLPPDASLRFGQVTISLAAASGAMFLLALFRPQVSAGRGATLVVSVLFVAIIAAAHFLFDWRLVYAVPLLASPLYIAIGRV